MTPAIIEPKESIEPGTANEYSITLENLSGDEQTFYLFVRNIKGVSGGNTPIFADHNEQTGYELADWVTLPMREVTIPGKGTAGVDLTIAVPENASPGSHFGALFISVEPPEIEYSGAAVGYQVANIITLRIAGEVIEKAQIRQFSTDRFIYGSQNVDFHVKVKNEGNVLIRPTGQLQIKNMLGKEVANLRFNEEEAAVFPFNTRDYDDIKWEGDAVGFGRYEAVISAAYGQDGKRYSMDNTVTFWILPMSIIGPVLGVLAFILLIVFLFVKLYIRRSLEQMNHSRRMVRRRRRGGSSAALLITVVMLTTVALFLIAMLAIFA